MGSGGAGCGVGAQVGGLAAGAGCGGGSGAAQAGGGACCGGGSAGSGGGHAGWDGGAAVCGDSCGGQVGLAMGGAGCPCSWGGAPGVATKSGMPATRVLSSAGKLLFIGGNSQCLRNRLPSACTPDRGLAVAHFVHEKMVRLRAAPRRSIRQVLSALGMGDEVRTPSRGDKNMLPLFNRVSPQQCNTSSKKIHRLKPPSHANLPPRVSRLGVPKAVSATPPA